MDWGAALLTSASQNVDAGHPASSGERQTEDGEAIGTRGFMAPEQIGPRRGDDRCARGCLRSRRRAVSAADRRRRQAEIRANRRSRLDATFLPRCARSASGRCRPARRSVSGRPEPRAVTSGATGQGSPWTRIRKPRSNGRCVSSGPIERRSCWSSPISSCGSSLPWLREDRERDRRSGDRAVGSWSAIRQLRDRACPLADSCSCDRPIAQFHVT